MAIPKKVALWLVVKECGMHSGPEEHRTELRQPFYFPLRFFEAEFLAVRVRAGVVHSESASIVASTGKWAQPWGKKRFDRKKTQRETAGGPVDEA